MLARHPACRRAVQSQISSSTEVFWITDEILAIALNQFSLSGLPGGKRFGSSVPGPLEARRRLAKRRMMNLSTSGGALTYDIGGLWGASSVVGGKDWTWEAP